MKTEHKQIKITHPDGNIIEVDENLAELLEYCWSIGLKTVYSCQNNFDKVYIQFVNIEDTAIFCSIAAGPPVEELDALFHKVRNINYQNYDWASSWRIECNIQDDENDFFQESNFKKANCRASGTIRFPVEDLPEVVYNFKQHIKNNNYAAIV